MDAILLSERISTRNSSPEIAKLTVKDRTKTWWLISSVSQCHGLMTVMTRHQRLTILTSTGKENRYFADVELTESEELWLTATGPFCFLSPRTAARLIKSFQPCGALNKSERLR